MQKMQLTILFLAVMASANATIGEAGPKPIFSGQDLHLSAAKMIVHRGGKDRQTLVFEDGFSMSIGSNNLVSDNAVVWMTTRHREYRGTTGIEYEVLVYLRDNISVHRGKIAKSVGLSSVTVEQGGALVVRFLVSGQVFATAQTRTDASAADVKALEIVQKAIDAVAPVHRGPNIRQGAQVPVFSETPRPPSKPIEVRKPWKISEIIQPAAIPDVEEAQTPGAPQKRDEYEYPVNLSDLWTPAPKIESTESPDGSRVTTIIGRFYFWQQRDEEGAVLEFQADTAVIFHAAGDFDKSSTSSGTGVLASGKVDAVYFKGNIVMTEGQRTVRADEIYYDFKNHQALAINAEMHNFDEKRGLPIYLRAEQLRQVSDTIFEAENITLTTSEFYLPQISMNASRLVLTDTTNIDARTEKGTGKNSYDGVLEDVDLKLGRTTVFSWPKIRTNFERPDVPISRLQIGSDSDMGNTVETRWYLARLLGKPEPEGVDSRLAVDYFSDRGAGAGIDIEYENDDRYGSVIGYVMGDRGTDDLGRTSDRKNVDSGEEIRGRFRLRHRQYLPNDWQATFETSYASDKNFLEWLYRSEFNVGKEQETLLHLKRISDNWGFSFLNKFRINDHQETTEELPTIEFHVKGASFWNHQLTYYSDTQFSRLRRRLPKDEPDSTVNESYYTFFSTRHEVDMPILWNTFKIVPFAATTLGMEDQDGFENTIDSTLVSPGQDSIWLNEIGVRVSTMFWRANQFTRSRFWDINGIRHIIKPHFEAVVYDSSDRTGDQRDMVNFGISQRWQTRRGEKDKLRSLDWMKLDVDVTLLSDDETPTVGPAKFMWNDPSIPIALRRSTGLFGIMRDSVNADYQWRVSDTLTILSDMNYDIKSGYVQQANVGLARYVYPDLSYYIGNRYLRQVVVDIPDDDIYEEGSNAFVTAITYALNERYTATLSQEYNFDYGKSVRSDLTLLRRYHRIYYGVTLSVDQTRDRRSVVFNVWPEGVKELALGSRKYVGITGPLLEE